RLHISLCPLHPPHQPPPLPLHLSLLQSYSAHRHLHSFPTRRSSDLGAAPDGRHQNCSAAAAGERRRYAFESDRRSRVPAKNSQRSEEHTSELQSPDHLVCRLLLEKKKQKLDREKEHRKHTLD